MAMNTPGVVRPRQGISSLVAIVLVVGIVAVAGVGAYVVSLSNNAGSTKTIGLGGTGQTTTVYSTVYSTVTYTDTSEIAQLQSQVDSLNSQLQSDGAIITSDSATIQLQQNQISTDTQQIGSLNSIINLQDSQIEVNQQPINWAVLSGVYYTFNFKNAGYVAVTVATSTDVNTQAQVTWSSNGISYSSTITIGTSGTAYYAVLPASNVKVTFSDSLGAAGSATVSITYYY